MRQNHVRRCASIDPFSHVQTESGVSGEIIVESTDAAQQDVTTESVVNTDEAPVPAEAGETVQQDEAPVPAGAGETVQQDEAPVPAEAGDFPPPQVGHVVSRVSRRPAATSAPAFFVAESKVSDVAVGVDGDAPSSKPKRSHKRKR